ncbi:uracil phosphoribosyltransferase [Dolosicoccus paucivorans]|uniref:Uracil phosphoribosyltransferase n=1 Tax=Dolosicoccus paucivorans TaxID=84521 RepID=A0A1G8NBQ3_9LACT|nr:uracil phosphoribosyltransferase [Dolosicoccus paucivorans]PMB84862.1 uracil phosphoribosyltransferase [Dolosicoccus paucivorans]PMC58858.1 uracil phosphoribosyltransferase [Dolosicoccus paucivorans]SDI77602.1 uracil phosphoribosyltransferase [Dolosicoccus paucivorans]
MSKVVVVDHPLIQHKLTMIRDKNTSTKQFRELTNEIGMLMVYDITRDLPLKDVEVETPLVKTTQKQLAGKKMAVIPILRAGLGMVDGIIDLVPAARIGHVGLYRDEETLEAVEYFAKFPQDIQERRLFVVDPMLATGGSAIAALDALVKKRDVNPENITFVCLVAAPEGVEALQEAYPDVDIYTAALDEKLNESGYIVPGLGDAGDRIFGTK